MHPSGGAIGQIRKPEDYGRRGQNAAYRGQGRDKIVPTKPVALCREGRVHPFLRPSLPARRAAGKLLVLLGP